MFQNKSQADQISSYFLAEWKILIIITISGIFYNFGLLAAPLFEGKLAGCLLDVLNKKSPFSSMLKMVLAYVLTISAVQGIRYIKRFYVRRFSNHVNRRMKKNLYHSLLRKSAVELEQEGIGSLMTKAISDVDDCAEGMRKFTTEVFDTGVVLICYCGMLFYYDWRLTLLCLIFPPISYFLAEKMKSIVQRTATDCKIQSGQLSSATMDRIQNVLTYRVFSCENQIVKNYETKLDSYEKSAVKSNIWASALPPLYQMISMTGCLFILYFGSRNVFSKGFSNWDIAIFTTYLSCYTKLSVKSSKAAKLFNAVHKAEISWKRIQPFMKREESFPASSAEKPDTLTVKNLSFSYPSSESVLQNISFQAFPGQIIGITGPVACGKSTLGKMFLCEFPYTGSILYGNRELSYMDAAVRNNIVSYLGHNPELLNDSIQNNILMGDAGNVIPVLRTVCMDEEVQKMGAGINSIIGSGGIKLSGGQAKRLALARTLFHKKPVLVLDDPFSALDRKTEAKIFYNLKKLSNDSIILLISHRLYLFPECDQIIWMENGKAEAGTHETLLKKVPHYAELYSSQKEGVTHEA